MPGKQINKLMQVLASFEGFDGKPPFCSDTHIYNTIDAISLSDIPWQSLSLKHAEFKNALPDDALWKHSEYEVWFQDPRELLQNQLANPDFKMTLTTQLNRYLESRNILAEDPDCHGAMFVPIILGSDKTTNMFVTTVSIATGQNNFYTLYTSAGNLRNNVCHVHKESAFGPAIQKPEVVKCAYGHFWRAVYSIGPYITDYPEQCLLACIIQRWCARCTADWQDLDHSTSGQQSHQHTKALMHSYSANELKDGWGIISGILPFTAYFPWTFKDHIMDWVGQYLIIIHGEAGAEQIWADIDCCIAALLWDMFPTRCFKHFHHFLDFCYLIHRSSLNEVDLDTMDRALRAFHEECRIFKDAGVTPDGISLPRQHSLCHYHYLVQQFGAPNGLCSSLTESKHHKAVKKPWRRSSGYLPL
ncbi:hypothetical protein BDR03DRAFT_933639 [Suillus americanus]|nr:hypothetical protein BDR03DRAFT_933639 [Suillus americanus]